MKQKATCLLRACGFLLVLGALMAALTLLFLPKNNREDFGMGEMKANAILTEPADTIDVLALGDSDRADGTVAGAGHHSLQLRDRRTKAVRHALLSKTGV